MSHALLSPSSASRWIACPPSARLEKQFPDKSTSYAEEGTLAHALNELLIDKEMFQSLDGTGLPQDWRDRMAEIESHEMYNDEMYAHCEGFATFVLEQFREAETRSGDVKMFTEQRLDMTRWVEDGFGTGDVVIIADGRMEIIDFKYGKGVPVFAENNKQMMLYALGALAAFDFVYDISEVRMTIYQPRLDSITSWTIGVGELITWAADVLTPQAKLAYAGEGEFSVGDHCYFCKAKAVCRAYANEQLKLAKLDFGEPAILSDEEVADVMRRSAKFISWIDSVMEYAFEQALTHGKDWPGFKIVESKKNRVYTDELAVADKLLELGYKSDEIYKAPEIKGIGAIEKLVGKKKFGDVLGGLVTKPKGVPTLAPEDDKRPLYDRHQAAAEDFKTNQ